MAWAANDEPRTTTKKPTTPATIATSVPLAQALVMKPENTGSLPHGPRARRQLRRPLRGRRRGRGRAQPPGGRRWDPAAEIDDDVDGHDEEADGKRLPRRAPVEAVVGEQDPEPGGDDAHDHGESDGPPGPSGKPQGTGGGADQ